MNLPNKLTTARLVLSPIFMVFLLVGQLWAQYVALAIFVAASLTDAYDGHLARRTGVTTGFGKFMDPLADKVLVTMALISFVGLGVVRAWMVLTIVAREFVITGLRTLAAYRGMVILPSRFAKVKTACQMVVVILILGLIVARGTIAREGSNPGPLDAPGVGLAVDGLLLVIMLLTLGSGVHYLVKNKALVRAILE
jgi:CDP-diacylglycerol--glycerol-3-phosphate 3-phosphatidyltransferase